MTSRSPELGIDNISFARDSLQGKHSVSCVRTRTPWIMNASGHCGSSDGALHCVYRKNLLPVPEELMTSVSICGVAVPPD